MPYTREDVKKDDKRLRKENKRKEDWSRNSVLGKETEQFAKRCAKVERGARAGGFERQEKRL
jgi:hypothetical protein